MTKKAYYGLAHEDADYGIAIVAESPTEAKQFLFNEYDGYGDWNWIDMRVTRRKDVNVDDLEIGIVKDLRVGLLRGFFSQIQEYECDFCGKVSCVEALGDKVLCGECYDEL